MWCLHKLPSKVSASSKVAKTLGLLDMMKYSTLIYIFLKIHLTSSFANLQPSVAGANIPIPIHIHTSSIRDPHLHA